MFKGKKSGITTRGIVVLLIIALLTAACSKNEPASNKGNSGGESKEAPVVKALMKKATDFPEDNAVIQEIRKKSGIDLQVQTVSYDDYEKRLNTLLVSNDAPDIFTVNATKIKELIDNKAILPLNELLEKNGSNITENRGDDLKGGAYVDGQIYGIPEGFATGNSLAIRKDWLDKLNLPVPTTLDEYEKVLKAFVNDDPDGNQQKDTIGLGLSVQVMESWVHIFGAYNVPMGRQVMVDGKVTPWMLAPGYLDAVKYLNKLYHEGLVDTEFMTIPSLQSYQKLWNGKIGAYNFNADGITQNWLSRYTEKPLPEFVYTLIKGPDGHGGYLDPNLANSPSYTVISSKSKNPEAAMQMLNFLVSDEGDALTWAGVEGIHYENKDGKFQWISPYEDAVKLRDSGGYVYSVLLNKKDGMRESLFNDVTKQGRQLAADNLIEEVKLFTLPQVQIDKGTILNDMEKEFRTKAILASGDIDQLYESFKQKYLAEGGNEWIEQATEIYAEEQATRK
ncbi:extracellular solute-binding protein [Cohnella cholangitidis]|uniref:Extracellular solute-binding protein n=1 Tax=Cohnella cholangitidis TaxID=2598458 RepID=A0A7G5BWG2_9BACL|nr:extracellular solute-binding protein [Cohnella cholangitidis]QMV41296.1 extracellular solute-binding protein [Cohnella cholangitidis]